MQQSKKVAAGELVENKGSLLGGPFPRSRAVPSAPASVKALRYAIPHEQRPLARVPWHAPPVGAKRLVVGAGLVAGAGFEPATFGL